jgi:hypothetical protein
MKTKKMKRLQKAIQSNDKELIVKLTKEAKAEAAKNVAKSEKLCKDIEVLQETLKRS